MTKKERYDTRKAAGLCVLCGKPAVEGQTKCLECKEKEKNYQKEIRQWRKSIGICTKCGKNPVYSGTTCLICKQDHREYMQDKEITDQKRAKQREYNKAMYDRRKAEGRCVTCNRPLPKYCKTVNCPECNAHKRSVQNEWVHETGRKLPLELRGNGKYCACCFKPVEIEGNKMCNRCYLLSIEKCAKMREKVPKDNYFRLAINAQWRESERNREKYGNERH